MKTNWKMLVEELFKTYIVYTNYTYILWNLLLPTEGINKPDKLFSSIHVKKIVVIQLQNAVIQCIGEK